MFKKHQNYNSMSMSKNRRETYTSSKRKGREEPLYGAKVEVEQWFSTRGTFCPTPPDVQQYMKAVLVSSTTEGGGDVARYYWHLLGRDQGYC